MEKRHTESLGKDVSLLGFGLMRLPIRDNNARKIDYAQAKKMVERAIAAGVNYFDTAWPYHEGASELFAGDVLSGFPRDRYFLASKIPTWEIKAPEDVDRIFAEQLKKCRVSFFDFYLVHCYNAENLAIAEKMNIYENLRDKKERGLIRHLGFSFHGAASLLQRIVEQYSWDFAQIQLNYLDWDTLDAGRQYEILAEKGIPVIVMEPVRGGALATLTPEAVAVLRAMHPEASPASWAIRYAASLPHVMTVLSGMSTMEQVEDNIATMSPFVPLSEEERKALDEAAAIYRASGAIPCTGCRYCMDCPSGVDIPRVLGIYNHYCAHKRSTTFVNDCCSLDESQRAQSCTACGECVPLCPQQIDIPEKMKEIVAISSGK